MSRQTICVLWTQKNKTKKYRTISTLRALKKKITIVASGIHIKNQTRTWFFCQLHICDGGKKNLSQSEMCLVWFTNRQWNLIKLLDRFPSSTPVQPKKAVWLIFICARSGARCHLLPHHHPAAMHHHSVTLLGTGRKRQIIGKWRKGNFKWKDIFSVSLATSIYWSCKGTKFPAWAYHAAHLPTAWKVCACVR